MISDTKKETERVRVEFTALQEEKIKRGDIDDAIQKLKEAQNEVKKMEIDKKEQDRFKRLHENRQNYKQMSTEEQQELRKEKEKEKS